jgi:uncharacterized protein (UPF0332 family)
MKPETAAFFAKARDFLDRAPALPAQEFTDEAGPAAYLAGFHAAQALLFEKLGRTPKTHSGLQSEFARLVKNEPTIDQEARAFLGRTYNLKAIADYETGPGSKVTPTQANPHTRRAYSRAVAEVKTRFNEIQSSENFPVLLSGAYSRPSDGRSSSL